MIDFVVKYWLQELFTLIVIIGGWIGKRLWKQYLEGRRLAEEKKQEEHDRAILDKINSMCEKVTSRIEKLEKQSAELAWNMEARNHEQDKQTDALRQGILALQKELFLKEGRDLLRPNHVITYEEFMAYTQQHLVYNGLGGNHEGDEQFALVQKKYHAGIEQAQKQKTQKNGN